RSGRNELVCRPTCRVVNGSGWELEAGLLLDAAHDRVVCVGDEAVDGGPALAGLRALLSVLALHEAHVDLQRWVGVDESIAPGVPGGSDEMAEAHELIDLRSIPFTALVLVGHERGCRAAV